MTLIDYIPFGRSNAIQAKALAKAAGFPDVRTLQQAIHSLRVQGVLIGAARVLFTGTRRRLRGIQVFKFHEITGKGDRSRSKASGDFPERRRIYGNRK